MHFYDLLLHNINSASGVYSVQLLASFYSILFEKFSEKLSKRASFQVASPLLFLAELYTPLYLIIYFILWYVFDILYIAVNVSEGKMQGEYQRNIISNSDIIKKILPTERKGSLKWGALNSKSKVCCFFLLQHLFWINK